ncbi:MAG: Mrp/NBP35 family ATP-binding protein [Bacteroidia bacterium]
MSELEDKILKALSHVEDPDLKKDLVSLNMIQNLKIAGKEVHFDLILTTPACPMKEVLHNACVTAIKTMVDDEMQVHITIGSQVTSNRASEQVMVGVKNIIGVASGKGGVGKTTVAVNLAKALHNQGATVGVLDADIHGPSVPVILKTEQSQPIMEGEKMQPIDKDGIKLMSIGFLVPKEQAIVWRGPMLASALKQFANDVLWGELDYLIIDLPPGTGDVHLSLIQQIPVTAMLMVTSPDDLSIADAGKAINMYQNPQLKQEILGVVENMSYFQPSGKEDKYYLFGQNGGTVLAKQCNLPLLAQIPISEKGKEHELDSNYQELAGEVARKLSVINANLEIA